MAEENEKKITYISIITCDHNTKIISACDSFEQAKKILGSVDDMLTICDNICCVDYDNYDDNDNDGDGDGDVQVCREFKVSINVMTNNIILVEKEIFTIEIKHIENFN